MTRPSFPTSAAKEADLGALMVSVPTGAVLAGGDFVAELVNRFAG